MLRLVLELDILNVIEKDWDFMTLDSCVPVKVALQLMDTSSLGRAYQYDAFRQTNSELQYALQAIVNGGAAFRIKIMKISKTSSRSPPGFQ